jgi:hypothetical protein
MMEPKAPPQDSLSSGVKYAIAFGFIVLIGIVAYMTVMSLRPMWDSLLVLGALMGFLSTGGWSLVGYMKAEDARSQSRQTYFQVNDRFDQFKTELEEKTARLVRESYSAGLKDGGMGAAGPPAKAEMIPPKTDKSA